jgi:hypothetical protein
MCQGTKGRLRPTGSEELKLSVPQPLRIWGSQQPHMGVWKLITPQPSFQVGPKPQATLMVAESRKSSATLLQFLTQEMCVILGHWVLW